MAPGADGDPSSVRKTLVRIIFEVPDLLLTTGSIFLTLSPVTCLKPDKSDCMLIIGEKNSKEERLINSLW